MVRSIAATEFKARCLELMDEVAERGVRYLVTKRGVPVAELVPVTDVEVTPFGRLRGTVIEEGDVVGPDHAAWAGSSFDPLDAP